MRYTIGYANIVVMAKRTPTYVLLEDRLGKNLERHVRAAWKRRESWNTIARDLHTSTGVAVTSETLRIWFPDLRPANRSSVAARANSSAA